MSEFADVIESLRILVVDDEDSIRKRCVRLLARNGYHVVGSADSQAALEVLRSSPFDIMLADIRMPGMDGIELMERVKDFDPSIEVIMMTGYASVETAVKAMKNGAYDYLTKPFDADELLHVVEKVAEKKSLHREIIQLRKKLEEHQGSPLLLGNSAAIDVLNRFIHKVSPVDCNILLYGESGTGKELVAKTIHANSHRSGHPFMVADCAALASSVLESELFGHVKGAFTGAHTDRKGYFETADGGTIFLDEIGELPRDLQGNLLRVVQEHVIVKVGATQPIKANVRIIAATNRDLEELVRQHAFREDLFYRLNVVNFKLPRLRDHSVDIPLLVKHFLNKFAVRLNLPGVPHISTEVLESLSAYDWPGNVRELENAVQRALVLCEDGEIALRDFLPDKEIGVIQSKATFPEGMGFKEIRQKVISDFTRHFLENSLRRHRGNITHVARELGMRRTSVQRLLKQSGVDAQRFREKLPPE